MIRAQNVTQHYGVRPILSDLSLTVETGELVAVIGPNGSGKSTLLSVLAGILRPQKGHVEIDGHRRRASIKSERAIRRNTVYLPDEPWLPMLTTGREYLLSVAKLYGIGIDRAIEHADRLLDLFCLTKNGDSPIRTYSTGQKKKIGLCAAVITDASTLLLDEPFSGGLDPAGIMAMKRLLQRFREDRARTVVFTTPVAEVVDELADRMIVLRNGIVEGEYRIDELRGSSDDSESVKRVVEDLVFPNATQSIQNYFDSKVIAG